MDLKCITWEADIYEKFEAVCLDVQEAIYKDTRKYVENQMQKVGQSVKTFYEEVMQDLLPPSWIVPVKVAAVVNSPLEPFSQTDINTKPKSSISENHGEINNKKDGNTSSEERTLLVRDIKSSCSPVVPDYLNATTPARHDYSEGVTKSLPISDAPIESCISDQTLSAESVKEDINYSESTSPALDKELSAESLRQINDATECNTAYNCLQPAYIDKFNTDFSLSEKKLNLTEEAIASYEDSFEAESKVESVEKSMLGESCILVEGDELYLVSQGSKKHKSYKKKIYDVFSSKLRSTSKKDLCIFGHEDLSDKNNAASRSKSLALAINCDKRKPPADSSCDFDWELL